MENKNLFIIIIVMILGGVLFINLSANKQKTTIRTSANTTQEAKTDEASKDVTETESSYSDGISLQITEPQNNQTVTTSSINVVGVTSAGAEVFINEMELRANGSGHFSTQINLDEGENIIFVTVNDPDGNSAEQELVVTYTP